MEIRTLTPQLLEGLDLAPQPFPIVGKFCPVLSRGVWSYEEELYSQPARTETNPALSRKELEEYAQGGGNVIFLAWGGGRLPGISCPGAYPYWLRLCGPPRGVYRPSGQGRGHGADGPGRSLGKRAGPYRPVPGNPGLQSGGLPVLPKAGLSAGRGQHPAVPYAGASSRKSGNCPVLLPVVLTFEGGHYVWT